MIKSTLTMRNLLKLARYQQSSVISTNHTNQNNQVIFKYENGELVTRSALVLRKKEQIQDYVLKTIKNYFSCTKRNALTTSSTLKEHGIDSLDAVEIAIQIEEDLGYNIPAENLALFSKVNHYINYIQHVEFLKEKLERELEI